MQTVYVAGATPLLTALAFALAAAALGPSATRWLPFERARLLGAMGAIASGVMLGAAYLIMATSMQSWPGITPLAAVITVPLIWFAHREMRRRPPESMVARRMALLHGIPEGIALGTVIASQAPLGVWLGATVALHNIAEGALFDARAGEAGEPMPSLARASYLALIDKMPQAVFAVMAWLVVHVLPVASAALYATAFAGLVYLVIAELLLEAYERIGRVGVALTVIAAGAVVAALGGR